MIYNQTSSKMIIAKVFRDFGIQNSDWINDSIEWIGEALELIGSPTEAVPKIRIIQSNNYRVPIPKDLYILDTIRYANSDADKKPDINEFKYIMGTGNFDLHEGLFEQERKGEGVATYFLDGSFIKTSFEDKWLAIEYKAFPLDEHGYPMIPDATEFREALSWYIMMKLLLSGQNHPVINYEYADQKWERNCVRARNTANMPDKSEYRSFKEKWVTMIPRYDRSIQQLEEAVTAENVVKQSYSKNIIG